MSFDDELEAFQAYAKAMPNNCVFLVDTYDTLEGVRKAVEVGKWLRAQGHEMIGIRLDSGDLAYLSIEARKILDAGGFPKALIVASNDLDEEIIISLKEQGAKIGLWGVGTKLVTAYDQPAIGGVYKLGAVRDPGGDWHYKVKLSEQAIKVSNPGIQQVRRYWMNDEYIGDLLYDEGQGVSSPGILVDPKDDTRRKSMPEIAQHTDLLVPIFRQGKLIYIPPMLSEVREKAQQELNRFHAGIKRFKNPHEYPVGLSPELWQLKHDLIAKARGK
jgi:nicotinate phosphoribosyltransferase